MSDKKLSIKDFKMWLEGVEEMQSSDWTPSPEQWKKIRSKIDNIQEEASQPPTQITYSIPDTIPTAPMPDYGIPSLPVPPPTAIDRNQLHPVFSTGNPSMPSRITAHGEVDENYATPFA